MASAASNGSNAAKAQGFLFEKFLDQRVFEVVTSYSSGRPALVFCGSRDSTKKAAEQLAKDATGGAAFIAAGGAFGGGGGGRGAGYHGPFVRDAAHAAQLAAAAARVGDARLAACLRAGVGYHSAGDSAADRALVESLFAQGQLAVCCTTTTLAMGELCITCTFCCSHW